MTKEEKATLIREQASSGLMPAKYCAAKLIIDAEDYFVTFMQRKASDTSCALDDLLKPKRTSQFEVLFGFYVKMLFTERVPFSYISPHA